MSGFDPGVGAGVDESLVPAVQPPDRVWRRPVCVPQCGDDADTLVVSDVLALFDKPVADLRFHGQILSCGPIL